MSNAQQETSVDSLRYTRGQLEILDQLLLPEQTKYFQVKDVNEGWSAINKMQVRGAPAIGVVAALSLAVELWQRTFTSPKELSTWIQEKMDYLVTARPTAVNILDSAIKLKQMASTCLGQNLGTEEMKLRIMDAAEKMIQEDIDDNKLIGQYGSAHMLQTIGDQPLRVLTHCNTGSLATVGYGTALGVIRALHEQKKIEHVYCTETRPYNQGARLTAYELVHDKMPATLICDSMAAFLIKKKKVNAIVLGADRIVANGDVANKIGTYQLAICAKYHGIPFYVAAPSTSIDLNLQSGDDIKIEERPHDEMFLVKGQRIAAQGIGCWNPAFDVTPHELVTGGIVTEFGVFSPETLKDKLQQCLSKTKQG